MGNPGVKPKAGISSALSPQNGELPRTLGAGAELEEDKSATGHPPGECGANACGSKAGESSRPGPGNHKKTDLPRRSHGGLPQLRLRGGKKRKRLKGAT